MSYMSVLHKHNWSMNHLGALLYWFGFSSWYGTWEFSFLQDPTWWWYCSSIDFVAIQPKLFALRFTTSQLLSWTASTMHHSDPPWKSNLPWGAQVADSLFTFSFQLFTVGAFRICLSFQTKTMLCLHSSQKMSDHGGRQAWFVTSGPNRTPVSDKGALMIKCMGVSILGQDRGDRKLVWELEWRTQKSKCWT